MLFKSLTTLFVLLFQLRCNILYTYVENYYWSACVSCQILSKYWYSFIPKPLIWTLRVICFNDWTFKYQSNYQCCVNEIRQITLQIVYRLPCTSRWTWHLKHCGTFRGRHSSDLGADTFVCHSLVHSLFISFVHNSNLVPFTHSLSR